MQALGITSVGAGKVPFICFDLAGGANISGSNVLVGGRGGQLDFLSTAGYSKLGLPGDMLPSASQGNFINTDMGLAFHSDSAFLRGIIARTTATTLANTNGAIIPARSGNDTGNNPHNPMYGIYKAGARGELLDLIGSRNSESGGNSVAPPTMIDLEARPTKVDRPSDVKGMVDTGSLVDSTTNDSTDAVKVMESVTRLSRKKLDKVSTGLSTDASIKDKIECAYVKSAGLVDRYGDPATLDPTPEKDTFINSIFPPEVFYTTQGSTSSQRRDSSEFQKTASVMKLAINGYAGAGTIQMGGFDYHTGDREVGENRDFRAGECMGACLEYAALVGQPLMLYVFSDGSVSSNGTLDNTQRVAGVTQGGGGKGVWTGDNGSTAASFFLVYNPAGRPALRNTAGDTAVHQQIGYMDTGASTVTSSSPAANNVNLLVEMIVLNYMALHSEQGNFSTLFPNHGLGSDLDKYLAFNSIV